MAKPSRIGKIHVGGLELPVHFYFESRSNSRVSLGKHAILVRLPFFKRGPFLKKDLLWVQQWVTSTYEKKPAHFIRLARQSTPHTQGEILTLFDRNITLHVHVDTKRKTSSAQWVKEGELHLHLNAPLNRRQSNVLISRALAKAYRPHFLSKVHGINDRHFGKKINAVRLKYNTSNWGSCSTNTNINLSTRLILVPEEVQNYIVVHELSHLIEMNHSPKFWAVVERVMPNYHIHETWLKEQGSLVDF